MFGFPLFEFMLLVFGFGFLIFVHELGHFMVAKWVGIRCPQFAIGFGHAIVSWRKGIGFRRGSTEPEYHRRAVDKLKQDGIKPAANGPHQGTARYDEVEVPEEHESEYTGKQIFAVTDAMGLGETEYRLNWLPLGGYVKMLGQEDMDPNAQSDDPSAYNNKPIRSRAAVISAGVVMNIIFGGLFLMTAFMIGVDFPTATVGAVTPGMPAATTFATDHDGDWDYLGLQPGDKITLINGNVPEDFKDVQIGIALGSSKTPVELQVERLGPNGTETLDYTFLPKRTDDGERLLSAGFQPGLSLDVVAAREKTEFHKWALKKTAMRVTAVDGESVTGFAQYLSLFRASGGKPLTVTITDSASSESIDVTVNPEPTLSPDGDGLNALLGMVPAIHIATVSADSPAAAAGVKEGDILKQIGDVKWPVTFSEVIEQVVEADGDPVRVIVLRDGETVDLGEIKPNKDDKLGIAPMPYYAAPIVGRVVEGSLVAGLGGKDGLLPGSQINTINGQPIKDWADLQIRLQQIELPDSGEANVTLTYTLPITNRPTETGRLTLDADATDKLQAASWTSGAAADFYFAQDLRTLKAEGLGDAFLIGMDKTKDFILQTYITLLRLVQGDVKIYNLRGPVGIVDVGTKTAQLGFPYLLYFLGLISINLAVINFLPIPVVDGGHMVFLLIEKIKGSPPSPQVQAASLYVGLALIGFVFVTTLFYDITRLIGL